VGQIDMLGGVYIRTGSVIAASGVRVVSGLVQRLGSLSFIRDNAGCLGGRPFPRDGRIMSFGSHEVYVGTERIGRKEVLVASDPPSGKLFSLSLKGRVEEWYRLLKHGPSIAWEEIVPLFYSKFYPPSEIHKDRNQIYIFWPHDGESIAQAWGRLTLQKLKCPIHELPNNIVIDNFYVRLALPDKDYLDVSCFGSFTHMKEDAKWNLLDRIQENAEGWVTRVNSTNVLNEGLRIGVIGRQMNSKVKLVETSVYQK
jgi:hypothetical protein